MYEGAGKLTEAVLADVRTERVRQFNKHGDQSGLPDGTGPGLEVLGELASRLEDVELADNEEAADAARARCKAASRNEGGDHSITFEHILTEEYFEAVAEEDKGLLYSELVQVAAVAVQWCEKLRSEGASP